MKTLWKTIGVLIALVVVFIAYARVFGLDPGVARPGMWLRGEVATPPADWTTLKGVGDPTAVVQSHQYFFPWLAHSVNTSRWHHNGRLYISSGYPAGVVVPEGRQWNRNIQADPRVRIRIAGKLYDGKLVYVSDPVERDGVWKEGGPIFWYPGFFIHLWRFEPAS